MCPDRQLLSVYTDHELPSPWKEKMEAHLRDCPDCRARLERYQAVSAALRAAPLETPAYAAEEARRERVWRHILQGNREPPRRRQLWNRTIAVPVPALIAAALAAAILTVGTITRTGLLAGPSHSSITSAGPNVQAMVPLSDMDEVFRYLGSDMGNDFVIIQLPESKNFMSSGKPLIIKATDYAGE